MWNLVFNRGFGPSFLWRLICGVLSELYLLPLDDSTFIDSPLSPLGSKQCLSLRRFLENPCADPAAKEDFETLANGGADTILVSSQLRRAAATAALGLSKRIGKTGESILLHSSCQEISRNFDTMSLAPAKGTVPQLAINGERPPRMDGSANGGNKTLGFSGIKRLKDFAAWAAGRGEKTIVVAGHSLWFRSFFQVYMPAEEEHKCKKSKIVNCGAIAFTLVSTKMADGTTGHAIKPKSVTTIYGGFEAK